MNKDEKKQENTIHPDRSTQPLNCVSIENERPSLEQDHRVIHYISPLLSIKNQEENDVHFTQLDHPAVSSSSCLLHDSTQCQGQSSSPVHSILHKSHSLVSLNVNELSKIPRPASRVNLKNKSSSHSQSNIQGEDAATSSLHHVHSSKHGDHSAPVDRLKQQKRATFITSSNPNEV